MKLLGRLIISSLFFISLLANATRFDSSYTSIKADDCRMLESHELGGMHSCPAFMGIKVKVFEDDLRQTIDFVRKGKEYPLELGRTISPAFSSLGSKIEWRYLKGKKKELKGIIVRFNVSEDAENAAKETSYLVVAKVNPTTICVVAKVAPQKKQNQKARDILEASGNMPCL